MSEVGAPAKRGEDTPVPEGVTTRGPVRSGEAEEHDELIPLSFVEQRAQERASRPAAYRALYVTDADPAPAAAAPNPLAAGIRPLDAPVTYPAAPFGTGPQVQNPYAVQPYFAPSYGPPPGYSPYGAAMQPYGVPAHPYAAPVAMLPPREPWRPGQRAAALWGSFVQHVFFGIAMQVFVLGSFFLLLTMTSWDDVEGFLDDEMPGTFTDFMVWLAKPENVALSFVILLLVTATLAAVGWFIGSVWQQHRGLKGRARAFWLTTVTGGSISAGAALLLSPATVVLWFMLVLFAGNGGFMASMWGATFLIILLGALANGFICMGFGRMFLSNARPRVDFARLAAEAEARARAEDERAMGAADVDARYRIDGT